MKYYIYVDESGSISSRKEEPFYVSLSAIRHEDLEYLRRKTKHKIRKMKRKIGISSATELKASELNKNNYKKEMHKDFVEWMENTEKIFNFGSYIQSGRHLENTKWINNTNITFNFLLSLALERMLENIEISHNDEIFFEIDNRNTKIGSLNSLQDYLTTKFVLDKGLISSVSISYRDSRGHWGIQMADLVCNYKWKEIKQGKENKNVRKLHI